jgi:hypothetical protein
VDAGQADAEGLHQRKRCFYSHKIGFFAFSTEYKCFRILRILENKIFGRSNSSQPPKIKFIATIIGIIVRLFACEFAYTLTMSHGPSIAQYILFFV